MEKNSFPRPNSNGYVPQPLDLDNVKLDEKIMLVGEQLASNFHDVWGRKRIEEGWAYGPVRDDQKKTNPCMVYYEDLPEEEKDNDRSSVLSALRFLVHKGYTIEEKASSSMAEVVSTAWTHQKRDPDKLNFDATVYIGLFGADNALAAGGAQEALTSALHSYFKSLHAQFGQEQAIAGNLRGAAMAKSKRYARYAHTKFVALSPISNEAERLAASIAAGYNIATYRVEGGSERISAEGVTLRVPGEAVDFICDHSFSALAMWDGIKGSDPRMEAIVTRALKGSPERLLDLDMPDNITVEHILTPSGKDDRGGTTQKLYARRTLHPYPLESGHSWFYRDGKSRATVTDKYNQERYERKRDKIAAFNSTVKARRDMVMDSRKVYDLMPGLHGRASSDRPLLRHLYADQISYSAQKKRDGYTKLMAGTAIVGLISYSLLTDAPDGMLNADTLISSIMIIALTLAMLIFFLQRRSGSHSEYVDFRLISECLRVQTYWNAAGVDRRVDEEFGAKSKLDFEWTRYILRSWALSDALYAPADKPMPDTIINEVKNLWCGRVEQFSGSEYQPAVKNSVDQYSYAKKAAERNRKNARKEQRVVSISIVIAFVLTAVVGLLIFAQSVSGRTITAIDYIALVASLVQIAVAGWTLYTSTKDYERIVNNNTWLSIEYQKSIMAYKEASNDDQRRTLLRRTGREAIREVCGWALEFSKNEPRSPIS